MGWLKGVVLDVAIVAVIAIYATSGPSWAWWVIAIYTPFMLLLKLAAYANAGKIRPGKPSSKKPDEAPSWFFHLAYALSVALLAYSGWYLMAGAWLLIWVLSFLYMVKVRPSGATA
ncbi:MAG: hypothetical protein R2832_17500 [Rhodothermales bacterium]